MKKTMLYKYVLVGSCLALVAFAAVRAIDNDLRLAFHSNPSIFFAIKAGNAEEIKTLISLGVDANEPNQSGVSPLQMALTSPHHDNVRFKMVNVLLENGADVNAQDLNGWSALHRLYIFHRYDRESNRFLLTLLDHGADPNIKDNSGMTPLTWATYGKCGAAIAELLERGANIGLYDAIYLGDVERVRAFVDAGHPLDEFSGFRVETPLMTAASENQFEIVEILLNAGANPNQRNTWNRTALMIAADTPIARLLLDRGADHRIRDNWGLTAVHYSACEGTLEHFEILIAAGAELDPETYTGEHTIHYAARNESPDLLAWLVEQDGIDIDKIDDSHNTPLHLACAYRKKAQVKLLVRIGANVAIADEQGRTPLHRAVVNDTGSYSPSREIAIALLVRGADPSVQDAEGRAPKDFVYQNPEFEGILW